MIIRRKQKPGRGRLDAEADLQQGRFSATVLLGEGWLPDPETLLEVLETRFGELGTAVVVEGGDDTVMALELDGTLIALERLETPLTDDPLAAAVQPARNWDPAPALAAHKAQLRVVAHAQANPETPEAKADPGTPEAKADPGTPEAKADPKTPEAKEPSPAQTPTRRAALAATALAGILARMAKAEVVYYPASGALLSSEDALRATQAVLRGVSPIEAWATIYVLGPGGQPDGSGVPHGGYTDGLEALLGREIELAPTPLSHIQAHDRLYGAIWKALDGEEAFEEGRELRAGDDTLVARIRAVEAWLRPGVPALVLVGPEAVVDMHHLELKPGVDPAVLRHTPAG
ncbi:MAG: hypothetical protein AAGI34_14900 [Pseudomonadota bacterium]